MQIKACRETDGLVSASIDNDNYSRVYTPDFIHAVFGSLVIGGYLSQPPNLSKKYLLHHHTRGFGSASVSECSNLFVVAASPIETAFRRTSKATVTCSISYRSSVTLVSTCLLARTSRDGLATY